jgi:hypothetical protein
MENVVSGFSVNVCRVTMLLTSPSNHTVFPINIDQGATYGNSCSLLYTCHLLHEGHVSTINSLRDKFREGPAQPKLRISG